jgi:hypothetical protein
VAGEPDVVAEQADVLAPVRPHVQHEADVQLPQQVLEVVGVVLIGG